MSTFLDEPVYADVDREARQTWQVEKPPRIRASDVLDDDELADYYQQRGQR